MVNGKGQAGSWTRFATHVEMNGGCAGTGGKNDIIEGSYTPFVRLDRQEHQNI